MLKKAVVGSESNNNLYLKETKSAKRINYVTNSILSEETNFAWKYTLTKSRGMKKKIFHANENQNWV